MTTGLRSLVGRLSPLSRPPQTACGNGARACSLAVEMLEGRVLLSSSAAVVGPFPSWNPRTALIGSIAQPLQAPDWHSYPPGQTDPDAVIMDNSGWPLPPSTDPALPTEVMLPIPTTPVLLPFGATAASLLAGMRGNADARTPAALALPVPSAAGANPIATTIPALPPTSSGGLPGSPGPMIAQQRAALDQVFDLPTTPVAVSAEGHAGATGSGTYLAASAMDRPSPSSWRMATSLSADTIGVDLPPQADALNEATIEVSAEATPVVHSVASDRQTFLMLSVLASGVLLGVYHWHYLGGLPLERDRRPQLGEG